MPYKISQTEENMYFRLQNMRHDHTTIQTIISVPNVMEHPSIDGQNFHFIFVTLHTK